MQRRHIAPPACPPSSLPLHTTPPQTHPPECQVVAAQQGGVLLPHVHLQVLEEVAVLLAGKGVQHACRWGWGWGMGGEVRWGRQKGAKEWEGKR